MSHPHAIVRAQTPEEREYERCWAAVAERKRRVAQVQVELKTLKLALSRFEAACHARVGDLLAELRRIQRAFADYERRLTRLRDPDGDPADLDGDDGEPDPFAWDDDGAWVGQERSAHGHVPRRKPARPRLDKDAEAEAKRLYRDLAKRCHPDFAQTDEERRRREAVMLLVNEAYRARDLAALRALWREAETDDPAFAQRPLAERLAWVREELARLDALLAELKAELGALRGSEAFRLWRRHEAGEAVIDALEDDLEARLAADGKRLDDLIATYRHVLDDRQRPAAVAT